MSTVNGGTSPAESPAFLKLGKLDRLFVWALIHDAPEILEDMLV